MDAGWLVREARRRSGLTLRELARLAGTSHAALSAYEHGRTVPRADTLVRILRAAGFEAEVTLIPRTEAEDRLRKGRELEAVLALADELPRRPLATKPHAVFGPRTP